MPVANFIQITPSMRGQFFPDRPQLPSGGDRQDEKENHTEYAKTQLNTDQNSGNVSCATNKWADYPDQLRLRH